MFVKLNKVWRYYGKEDFKTVSIGININSISYMEKIECKDSEFTSIYFNNNVDSIWVIEPVEHILQMIEDLNLTK